MSVDELVRRFDEFAELGVGPIFRSGFDSLTREIDAIYRRIGRGRARADDRESLEACRLALAEMRALYRATLRIKLEGLERPLDPLDVALIQAEELLADDLTLRSIPFETREALRRDREADWSVVLYRLAGSGSDPVA